MIGRLRSFRGMLREFLTGLVRPLLPRRHASMARSCLRVSEHSSPASPLELETTRASRLTGHRLTGHRRCGRAAGVFTRGRAHGVQQPARCATPARAAPHRPRGAPPSRGLSLPAPWSAGAAAAFTWAVTQHPATPATPAEGALENSLAPAPCAARAARRPRVRLTRRHHTTGGALSPPPPSPY